MDTGIHSLSGDITHRLDYAAGISSRVQALQPDFLRGHFRARPHSRKAAASPPSSLLALITVLSLVVVYLISRCAGTLKVGYNESATQRRLAEGGESPPPTGCLGEGSKSEEVEEAGEAQQGALQAGNGYPHQTPTSQIKAPSIQDTLATFKRVARSCRLVVKRLPLENSFVFLGNVVSLQLFDLACLSLITVREQPKRCEILNMYTQLLRTSLGRKVLTQNLFTTFWFAALLVICETMLRNPPRVNEAERQKILLSNAEASYLSATHTEQILDRLMSSSDPQTGMITQETFTWGVRELTALREFRAFQVLRVKLLRGWLVSCQSLSGTSVLISAAQFLRAEQNHPIPPANVQLAAINAVARDFWGIYRSLPPEEAELLVAQLFSASGGALTSGEGDPSFVQLEETAHNRFLQLFDTMERLAAVTEALVGVLSPKKGVELVCYMTRLAALELGGSWALTADLEQRRKMVAGRFFRMGLETLNTPQGTTSPMAQELRSILLVFARVQFTPEIGDDAEQDSYRVEMETQGAAALFAAEHMLRMLEAAAIEFKGEGTETEGSPEDLSSPANLRVQRTLAAIMAVTNLRSRQIAARPVIASSLRSCQSRAGLEVLVSSSAPSDCQFLSRYTMLKQIRESFETLGAAPSEELGPPQLASAHESFQTPALPQVQDLDGGAQNQPGVGEARGAEGAAAGYFVQSHLPYGHFGGDVSTFQAAGGAAAFGGLGGPHMTPSQLFQRPYGHPGGDEGTLQAAGGGAALGGLGSSYMAPLSATQRYAGSGVHHGVSSALKDTQTPSQQPASFVGGITWASAAGAFEHLRQLTKADTSIPSHTGTSAEGGESGRSTSLGHGKAKAPTGAVGGQGRPEVPPGDDADGKYVLPTSALGRFQLSERDDQPHASEAGKSTDIDNESDQSAFHLQWVEQIVSAEGDDEEAAGDDSGREDDLVDLLKEIDILTSQSWQRGDK